MPTTCELESRLHKGGYMRDYIAFLLQGIFRGILKV